MKMQNNAFKEGRSHKIHSTSDDDGMLGTLPLLVLECDRKFSAWTEYLVVDFVSYTMATIKD